VPACCLDFHEEVVIVPEAEGNLLDHIRKRQARATELVLEQLKKGV
jgi:hypothetical protein